MGNKNLESQCGYVAAFAHMCERCMALSKRGKFGGKGFTAAGWEPYQEGAVCMGKCNKLINTQLSHYSSDPHTIYIRFPVS